MAIVRGLISLADARDSIYGSTASTASTARDSTIELYISAATRVIEGIPNVGPQYAESRTLTLDGGSDVLVLPFKFNAVTSVTVNGSAVTDYVADGSAGLIWAGTETARSVFSAGTKNVDVVVTVGSSPVLPHVQLAARELVTHWWRQGQQGNRPAFGDGGGLPPSSDPAVQFGVPTRRLMELLESSDEVPGFA